MPLLWNASEVRLPRVTLERFDSHPGPHTRHRTPILWLESGMPLQHDAQIAQALVAFQQVDLLHGDQPAAVVADEAVAGPAGERAHLLVPELADQKIGPHHAGIVATGREHLDVRDDARGARRRRLRPGEAGARPADE